jgi:uncharacterized RDD family membrane protein YckC
VSSEPQSQVPPGGWDRPVAGPPPLTAPYAGWWSRVGAALFDLLVISVPAVVLAVLIFGSVGAAFSADDEFGVVTLILGLIAYVSLLFAAVILYAPLLMRRAGERNGQTWGKQLVGIRVVRTNGVPMDFTHSAIREALVKGLGLGFASSIIPLIPYLLDVLWPLWDDEHRAIHDMVVGTRVVDA